MRQQKKLSFSFSILIFRWGKAAQNGNDIIPYKKVNNTFKNILFWKKNILKEINFMQMDQMEQWAPHVRVSWWSFVLSTRPLHWQMECFRILSTLYNRIPWNDSNREHTPNRSTGTNWNKQRAFKLWFLFFSFKKTSIHLSLWVKFYF